MPVRIALDLYESFVAVAETKSVTAAARRLRSTKATVSRSLARLERELGAKLVLRSSRSMSLSAAGQSLYDKVATNLLALRRAETELAPNDADAVGTLIITSAIDFGQLVLPNAIALCAVRHPRLRIEMRLSNQIVDITAEGVDLAVRLSTTRLKDSNLVVKKIGDVVMGAYASPGYLAKRGTPKRLGDESHDWLVHAILRRGFPKSADARVIANDMVALRELAIRGSGVAVLARFAAASAVVSGELSEILPGHATVATGIFVVHSASGRASRNVNAFRDALIETLRFHPLPRS